MLEEGDIDMYMFLSLLLQRFFGAQRPRYGAGEMIDPYTDRHQLAEIFLNSDNIHIKSVPEYKKSGIVFPPELVYYWSYTGAGMKKFSTRAMAVKNAVLYYYGYTAYNEIFCSENPSTIKPSVKAELRGILIGD